MAIKAEALLELLRHLQTLDYRFTCVTPTTHERVLARPTGRERTLRDIFGWNRTFAPEQLPSQLLGLLTDAGCVQSSNGLLQSLIRVANIGDRLFLHSSFPTTSPNAVFFGPDTYRFVRFVHSRLRGHESLRWIVDMGAGSGAAGIIAAGDAPSAQISLVDINPRAAQLASVNAAAAGARVETLLSDRIPSGCDLVIANPPYMIDPAHRAYRDGGGLLGGELALQWVRQALDALVPGGTMLLYTGVAVVAGRAPLLDQISSTCEKAAGALHIDEIDPDVFGEELLNRGYHEVERIAAVGITITLPQ